MKIFSDKRDPDEKFVLLSIGCNIGDRQKSIEEAYEHFISSEVLCDAVMSSFYETEPVGITEQAWFLNVAVAGYTVLSPYELLQACKTEEYNLGRERRDRWHERELDIDIILYDGETIAEEKLTIPHTRMHKRRFVLVPSAEIAPNVLVPGFNQTIVQLLAECPDTSEVICFG